MLLQKHQRINKFQDNSQNQVSLKFESKLPSLVPGVSGVQKVLGEGRNENQRRTERKSGREMLATNPSAGL